MYMAKINEYRLSQFLELPDTEVALLVNGLTLAFPIDGTRRWFLLHYPEVWDVEKYMELSAKRYVEQFSMLFDHGIETILVPAFGAELMSRGEEYVRQMMKGMSFFAKHPVFEDFYRTYNVRVRFYGDWRRQSAGLPGGDDLISTLDECPASQHNGPRRIFYGLWADDMLVSIADDLAHSQLEPLEFTREAIIKRYYGEYVRPTDIYIGFGRPAVFDVPMLVTSQTDLYYTAVPSLDLDSRLLRMILWDHFVGRWTQQEWDNVSEKDLKALQAFYEANHDFVLGLGDADPATGIWFQRGISPLESFRQ
jgi:tuberculosinol/isotuberculosinol synthase